MFKISINCFLVLICCCLEMGCIALPMEENEIRGLVDSEQKAIILQKETAVLHKVPIEFENELGMKFRLIPAGTFYMGSPPEEVGRQKKERQHLVKISKPFYISITEVTQKQWKIIADKNPSKNKGEDLPVEHVTYHDALTFIKNLNTKLKKNYRLPTEAEWEFSCRSGTKGPYASASLNDIAWYNKNTKTSSKVMTKSPNAFGLYDMHGNVWEWCSDYSGSYRQEYEVDPLGSKNNSSGNHVRRGGSYKTGANICRSSYRNLFAPMVFRHSNTGFRLVLNLP